MSKLKKAILIVFTMLFIMNLQINTSLTEGMNGDFSLAKLVENVFFPSAYATGGAWIDYGLRWCTYTGELYCGITYFPHVGCFPGPPWPLCSDWP